MKNPKKVISSTEISKFIYCPYQWYYERYYGRKVLRDLELERNKRLNLEDTRMSNLKKGHVYHDGFKFSYTLKMVIMLSLIFILATIFFYLLFRVNNNV